MDDVVGSDAMELLPESIQKKRKGPHKVMEGMVECGCMCVQVVLEEVAKGYDKGAGCKIGGEGLGFIFIYN